MKFQITSTKSQTNHSKRFWSFEFGILKLFVICILWFVIFSLNEAHAALISKPPTNLGLVGYWSMNEGTGSYAGDSSGNKNTGTLTNGPTWVDGKRGKALNFDGVNDYVNLGSGDIMSSNATLSLWFKMSPISDYKFLFSTKSNETDRLSVFTATNGRIVIQVLNGSNNAYVTTLDYDDNKWHHLVFVRNGNTITNGILYIDNNPVGIASWGNFGSDSTNNVIGIYEQTLSYPFNGLIDDVRVYNRALTAAEIQALYKSGQAKFASPSGTGLVGYWSMDEGSGSYATDSSGNKNTGILTNGPTWVDGKRGKALNFDGSNDYVSIGNPQSGVLDFGTNSFSYGSWIYNTKLTSSDGIPVGKYNGGYGPGYDIELRTNKMTVLVYDGTAYKGVSLTTSPPLNKWVHFFAVVDRATNYLKGYKDGVFIGQTDISTLGSVSSSNSLRLNGYGPSYWGGLIDDVRIYNRALTPSEVEGLYKFGAARFAPPSNTGLVGYWSFDDGAGTSATDFSGKNNAGVFPGGTANPTWVDGKRGKALSFDGGDYISFSNPINQANLSQEWTVAAWAKLSTGSGSSYQFLISGLNAGVKLMHGVKPLLYLNCCTDDYYMYGTTDLRDNKWHYVAFVFRNSDGLRKIYVDGRDDSSSGPNNTSTPEGMNATFNLGSQVIGSIDDVRVYNRALSAAEVQTLYNSR
ncbi:MAG: LamG domain protein jellyroll fold domain protein [Candidatus Giovannonibacteria bacterium GW2011_GWA2_45_21]|uniref:LamG domain protein jellyroll fold domain protein n=1 Tax=Candidatus Giovannonibacteria bacterium GW2011_GWA2_45_21 TaxID=1618649 RepID=A0A0G1M673_9BACT|nr:MAG: LamG domain protein jellyroll fold domain protein [Candidatus Giovannonibacteria bacterium GW2011_GWA2_45_21]